MMFLWLSFIGSSSLCTDLSPYTHAFNDNIETQRVCVIPLYQDIRIGCRTGIWCLTKNSGRNLPMVSYEDMVSKIITSSQTEWVHDSLCVTVLQQWLDSNRRFPCQDIKYWHWSDNNGLIQTNDFHVRILNTKIGQTQFYDFYVACLPCLASPRLPSPPLALPLLA